MAPGNRTGLLLPSSRLCVCAHLIGVVGPLEGPGVRDGGVPGHDVRVRLLLLVALPRFHHGRGLPVGVLVPQTRTTFRQTVTETLGRRVGGGREAAGV